MSEIKNIRLKYNQPLDDFIGKKHSSFKDFRILSKSLDARAIHKGGAPYFNYQVELIEAGEEFSRFEDHKSEIGSVKEKPVIVGAGPAGIFAALRLLDYGVSSIILERGAPVDERMKYIARFWRYGEFSTEVNVCYGAGGAGLYSDGKLMTRVKSPWIKYVMRKLVEFGAPADTEYLSNPHLGSNKLRGIIKNILSYLEEKGCEIKYFTKVDELIIENSNVSGVRDSKGVEYRSEHILLAAGHAAKDLYQKLFEQKVQMKNKPFAVGVRVEHPRVLMNKLQYGKYAEDDLLGTARYRLSYHNHDDDRGTFSFCMCPGGHVLSSGTEADGIVTNGMSNYFQKAPWSNSAIVVTVKPGRDFSENPLAGFDYQRAIERRAFELSKEHASGRELPSQRLVDFLKDRVSDSLPNSSTPSKTVSLPVKEILPEAVTAQLKTAFETFNRKIPGFIAKEALLLAPETRTSSPITIERDSEKFHSLSYSTLFPCGEGSGHAGGITSSAVDGIKVVEAIVSQSLTSS